MVLRIEYRQKYNQQQLIINNKVLFIRFILLGRMFKKVLPVEMKCSKNKIGPHFSI